MKKSTALSASEALNERHKLAEQDLASRYDVLNQLFTEAELHLKGLKPVHAVWVEYGREEFDGGFTEWELLGFTKYQGKWRLCHALDGNMYEDCLNQVKPIIECPVETRVKAAPIVRKLHQAIIEAKEKYIPEVDAAINELTQLCCEI